MDTRFVGTRQAGQEAGTVYWPDMCRKVVRSQIRPDVLRFRRNTSGDAFRSGRVDLGPGVLVDV